jgi:hypothetical protein
MQHERLTPRRSTSMVVRFLALISTYLVHVR